MKTHSICAAIICACAPLSSAAVPRDFAVDLKATTSDSIPYLTLSWTIPSNLASQITAQRVYRRLKGGTTWETLATLTNTQTSYADATAASGVEYEYWLQRTFVSSVTPSTAMGYLSAGVKVPAIEARGKLLLVVDDTMLTPLAGEIAQLKADLAADGWVVQVIPAPRYGGAIATRALITAAYNADTANVKAVYVLGHVPVPYSGNQAPDGHTDHTGAWPADGYYGEMNGNWTDATVNNTSATSARNDNVPGDGKFDQLYFPNFVELQVGRVDLNNMDRAPSTYIQEATRLRHYLKRAHDFRHKLGAYANIPRRSVIRDGFGYSSNSEPFAVTGWACAFNSVGGTVDETPTGEWFSSNYAGGKDYLWGYACGPGGYDAATTVGRSIDFGRKPSRVVFTSIFGSYHGDWDSDNNFMRAALAGNATGDSLGLCCFWAGRPNWFTHPLGMGETLGYMTKISMNASMAGGGGYMPGGSGLSAVHVGLMGDPALRLHMVEPPRKLAATSANGTVSLNWAVSTETAVAGYHVYRGATTDGPFTRLTTNPLATNSYTDTTATTGTGYAYLVRTLKLESVPGGSYYNLSLGSAATITVNGGAAAPANAADLTASAYTGPGARLTWSDNAGDETGFRIERRTGAAGAYAVLTTVTSNVMQYDDPGPLTPGNMYYYRVTATGGGGDAIASNEASFEANAGLVEFAQARYRVNKNAGTASVTLTRYGGGTGAVSVDYSTTNLTALAGTHFTAGNGTVNWADGEQGIKTITIPVTNTSTPQLPRQFKLLLGNATNGLGFSTWYSTSVEIEDSTASLAPPWSSTVLGTLIDSSPAVSAEGVIGDATLGGSGAMRDANSDAGRFIYQTRSGDGVLVTQVPMPAVNQGSARFAVMVRASTAANSIMAATVTASNSEVYFGTRIVSRSTTDAAAINTPDVDNGLLTPRWIRITRTGNTFLSESSANGIAWTTIGSTTIAGMPATALWGIFHYSAGLSSSTGREDFHLATYQNVSLGALPAPFAFIATPGGSAIALAWTDASSGETGFVIERQAANGTWSALQTTAANASSFPDTTVLPGVSYSYRIKAVTAAGDSSWVTATATAPGTASGYRLWLQANGLPMDETGTGSATATPSNDDLPNLVKYALGLTAADHGQKGRLSFAPASGGTGGYITFSYTRPEPAPADLIYAVEGSSDLNGPGWNGSGISSAGSVTNGNTATVTVRLDTAPPAGGKYFMRLKVTQQ